MLSRYKFLRPDIHQAPPGTSLVAVSQALPRAASLETDAYKITVSDRNICSCPILMGPGIPIFPVGLFSGCGAAVRYPGYDQEVCKWPLEVSFSIEVKTSADIDPSKFSLTLNEKSYLPAKMFYAPDVSSTNGYYTVTNGEAHPLSLPKGTSTVRLQFPVDSSPKDEFALQLFGLPGDPTVTFTPETSVSFRRVQ